MNEHHIEGDAYFNGSDGKERNEEKAVKCWLKGAEIGHVQCMRNLAWAYLHGRGVTGNALQSRYWTKRTQSAPSALAERKATMSEGLGREVAQQERDWTMNFDLGNDKAGDSTKKNEVFENLEKLIQRGLLVRGKV